MNRFRRWDKRPKSGWRHYAFNAVVLVAAISLILLLGLEPTLTPTASDKSNSAPTLATARTGDNTDSSAMTVNPLESKVHHQQQQQPEDQQQTEDKKEKITNEKALIAAVQSQIDTIDHAVRQTLPPNLLNEQCTTTVVATEYPWGNGQRSLTAEEATQRNQLRYDKCFHEHASFLYFGNNWGRHFNQVTSLLAALVLSRSLNRTLVVPPFVVDKQRLELWQLYDARPLLDVEVSPYCVLTEREWYQLESKRLSSAAAAAGTMVVPATCITMRGIKPFPQSPESFTFDCNGNSKEPTFIKYKKNLTLFFDTVGFGTRASQARFLTVPLVIYYAQAMPLGATLCPWRLLQPHPHIQQAVNLVYQGLPHGAEAKEAMLVVGVHHRSLEGSCEDRMKKFSESPAQRKEFVQQCLMKASYVQSVAATRSKTREMKDNNAAYLIADDGQDPSRVQLLLQQLGDTAKRLGSVTSEATKDSPFKRHEAFVLQKQKRGSQDKPLLPPPYEVTRSGYPAVPNLFALQVDYWSLVFSHVFVGNQISTVSMNVCRARLARFHLCENFVF